MPEPAGSLHFNQHRIWQVCSLRRMFQALYLNFKFKKWFHFLVSTEEWELHIPVYKHKPETRRFLNWEFTCFSSYQYFLPALFKSLSAFSNSFSLKLCILLPSNSSRHILGNFWPSFILSLLSNSKRYAQLAWQAPRFMQLHSYWKASFWARFGWDKGFKEGFIFLCSPG